MTGKNNHESQAGNKTNVLDIGSSSKIMKGPILINTPQVDMHALEENIVSKVLSEVDNVMTTVKTRVQGCGIDCDRQISDS